MASTEASLFSFSSTDELRLEKSPTALRTISEASEALDVPQHVLRFWETKFPQVKPLKRNGGRRFYRPQDLEVLEQIKHLLYAQGYTIKGAKKAVDEFIETRSRGNAVSASEWLATVPPASVNDNYLPEQQDVLAELAEALTIDEPAAPVQHSAFPRETLRALRAELLDARALLLSHVAA